MSISRDLKNIDPKKIKALAMDLDGTILAPGAVLTQRTSKAIRDCKERGIQIILATGRSLESAERFRLSLGAEGLMVYHNGAIVVEMPGDKVHSAVLLETGVAEVCVDAAREMDVYCQLYISHGKNSGRTTLMAEKDCPERNEYFEHTTILSELGDLKDVLRRYGSDNCTKVMYLIDPDLLPELRASLEERLRETAYISRTLPNYLEVMNPRVSKGKGLKYIMERYSYRSDEVIAIGDAENDLPMFEVAGFSAAPASSKDSVKARADFVVGSNSEDGVAIFLEEIFGL